MEVIKTEQPIAKKRHICMVCGCPIEPGTKYFHQVNDFDGFCDFKGHEECVRYDMDSRESWDDESSSPDNSECWVMDDLTDILGTQEAAWDFRTNHTLLECIRYIQDNKKHKRYEKDIL